jgi:hypothetical protein
VTDNLDLALESGIDESATHKFAGSDVVYGSAASGAGNNREIPLSEGGSVDPRTGKYVSRFSTASLDM